jgi:hypothetical protein
VNTIHRAHSLTLRDVFSNTNSGTFPSAGRLNYYRLEGGSFGKGDEIRTEVLNSSLDLKVLIRLGAFLGMEPDVLPDDLVGDISECRHEAVYLKVSPEGEGFNPIERQ